MIDWSRHTWYIAYLGMILSDRRVVLKCIKMMATGHRAMMVKMPTNGLIQMAAPVMFNWNTVTHSNSYNGR